MKGARHPASGSPFQATVAHLFVLREDPKPYCRGITGHVKKMVLVDERKLQVFGMLHRLALRPHLQAPPATAHCFDFQRQEEATDVLALAGSVLSLEV